MVKRLLKQRNSTIGEQLYISDYVSLMRYSDAIVSVTTKATCGECVLSFWTSCALGDGWDERW